MTSSMILAFVALKVALALLFWRAAVKGLALGERIEARKRAEREGRLAAERLDEAAGVAPGETSRPAA